MPDPFCVRYGDYLHRDDQAEECFEYEEEAPPTFAITDMDDVEGPPKIDGYCEKTVIVLTKEQADVLLLVAHTEKLLRDLEIIMWQDFPSKVRKLIKAMPELVCYGEFYREYDTTAEYYYLTHLGETILKMLSNETEFPVTIISTVSVEKG
jgi:hypothetical protein